MHRIIDGDIANHHHIGGAGQRRAHQRGQIGGLGRGDIGGGGDVGIAGVAAGQQRMRGAGKYRPGIGIDLPRHHRPDRVQLVRSIEREGQDAAAAFDADRLVGREIGQPSLPISLVSVKIYV